MKQRTTDGLARVRGLLHRFTTPLLPDDYSVLLNPLWSTRELRGKIDSVERQGDAVHLRITPGWGVPTHFEAGQYIGIGVEVDGRYTWRSYSLTNAPTPEDGTLSITVRAVEKGKLSNHLVGTATPGTTVRLAAPAGDFHLSDPPPAQLAFVTAGTGITPIISMLRTMEQRGQFGATNVAVVYSSRHESEQLFTEELQRFAETYPENFTLVTRITSESSRITPENIEQFVPDITQRTIYACGPSAMLDDFESWAKAKGVTLRTERFSLERESDAEGGTITFPSGRSVTVDGATTVLEASEQAGAQLPFGCRMGICHTCTRTLAEGHAMDLRTGEEHEPGSRFRTCVSVACGDITVQ
ncbi:ferredoxin reductase [Corynebacterium sp. 153RC1]|uniref:ferredoxin reductase n=1 Tax=Corynebacterium TaxID=1716 RepID=UPI00211C4B9C|nr:MULTISPECIES: ferredoxin reductase [unclassified Corynebacterium]MCQ9371558.1 ferredoxin reductase [Corynebacterium sp. 35RC1]MCQ9343097.1 ferredoxin reductase [Corynebacterium sp. 76QC2CO]MCQ9352112.1 ferredoxin reductase [Corynebacterium sp. 209RC1]MCQ9354114.1 ferredoxin reductase [Corynebacterium sp. 1222RC1]MCQ9356394.1 ferredoxin reductase [Corynebacterium sp. 122RC1]